MGHGPFREKRSAVTRGEEEGKSMKVPQLVYVDNNVFSGRVRDTPPTGQTLEAAELWDACALFGIRLVTSAVTLAEHERGEPGEGERAKRRKTLLLKSIPKYKEPVKNARLAVELLQLVKDKVHARALFDDARHFLMAVHLRAPFIVTFNTSDFKVLYEAYRGQFRPMYIRPGDLVHQLYSGTLGRTMKNNPPYRPHYPPLRGSIKKIVADNKRVQARIAREFFAEYDKATTEKERMAVCKRLVARGNRLV